MFSERERDRALLDHTEPRTVGSSNNSSPTPIPDTLFHLKQTLHVLLRSAAGVIPDRKAPEKVFALCDTSRHGVPYLYVVVACMRLDVGSHTVVADAFVALATPAVRAALETAVYAGHDQSPRKPDHTTIHCIGTDADETTAWFHLLPRLVERCRTWPHKTSCTYRHVSKHQEQKPAEKAFAMWERRSPLCACGMGIGAEILPKAFERVVPYLTRAAFSPLFSVPYLKEVDVPVSDPKIATGKRGLSKDADTRKTPPHDQNDGVNKTTNVVGEGCRCRSCGKEGGLACSRCKRVRYCSKECQRADWKGHKKDCGSVV